VNMKGRAYDQTSAEFIRAQMLRKTRKYLASGSEEVPDGEKGQGSPFANRLLELLKSHGINGIVTYSQVVTAVEQLKPTPATGPFFENDEGGTFIFQARAFDKGEK